MMLLTPTPKLLNATRNLTLGKLRGHLGKLNVSYIINSYQFGIDKAASCLNSRMSSRYILRDRKVSTWLPDTTRLIRVWCISDKGNPLCSNLIKYFSSSRSVVYTRDWIIKKEILEVMLKKGLAWHYLAYDKRPELAKARFYQWENEAKQKRIGLWAAKNPEKPWEWRKNKRGGN
ncbi:hypothetical protein DY000_02056364 [Brassica cretica]|uniref:TNase-like domain-containing protein n=1 Tax=Brassica cretica TaxID=69181 RepID=A0ABQ7AAJ8_BRACR|nr:hypothetical protein DY000_02056364 [Brassica cretica]